MPSSPAFIAVSLVGGVQSSREATVAAIRYITNAGGVLNKAKLAGVWGKLVEEPDPFVLRSAKQRFPSGVLCLGNIMIWL